MDGIERETRELTLLTINQMRRIYTEESGTQAVAPQAVAPQAVAGVVQAVAEVAPVTMPLEVLITVAEDILM
jgi:hypothetical protein